MNVKHTSTPWEVDGLKTEGAHGKYTAYALLSPEGKVICDTINGGLQTEVVEHDEDGTTVYDAQGLADMAFAALAANNYGDLVKALEFARGAIFEIAKVIDAALIKARGP